MNINCGAMPALKLGNLEVSYPIIQGGMGIGISIAKLATAVANKGGVGVLSAVGMGVQNRKNPIEESKKVLANAIREVRKNSKGILGVNIMVALSNFSELVKTAIAEEIDIIFAGAGLPLDLPKYADKTSKTKLVPIVSSARAAGLIIKKWMKNYDRIPDAIVVEGPLAGGHLGFKKEELFDEKNQLEVLVRQVIDETKKISLPGGISIPVIAAGGIYSGQDIYEYIKMGAAGVQMGTRFVATEECDASMEFKQAYINCTKEDLEIIKSPVGMPGRVINNSFVKSLNRGEEKPVNCSYRCIKSCPVKESPYCIAEALFNAKEGDMDKGFAFAGENVYKVDKIVTVGSLMDSLDAEYIEACNNDK